MKKNLLFAIIFISSSSLFSQALTITTEVCTAANSVRMTGPFWGWGITSGPEAVDNGNGTWTFNLDPAPQEDMEYLLIVDGFQENLIPGNTALNDWSCTPVTDQSSYANRQWIVGSGDVTNVFGTCSSCEELIVYGCTDETANNYNIDASVNDGSCLFGISLPINFEGSNYSFVDFEGGFSEVVENPNSSGINTSQNVVKHIRNVGSAYAGTFIPTEPIDFSSGFIISIKVHSPKANIPVLFKLDSETGANIEIIQMLEVANEWVEMQYDFGTQPSDVYTKIVAIFNAGTLADGSENSTYYFDDIEFSTGPILGCTDEEANNYNPSANLDDGSCTYGIIILNIDVNPCMEADSVRLTGPFWGWDDAAGPSAVKNSNGTWTFTEEAPSEDMEYLIVVDGIRENLVAAGAESGDWSCTPVTDYFSYANRKWEVGSGDVTDVTFGSCGSCGNDFSMEEMELNSLIYPNPASEFINLDAKIVSLEIYSITGQQKLSLINTNNNVDISSLPIGIYTLKLINVSGIVSYTKFIKENK